MPMSSPSPNPMFAVHLSRGITKLTFPRPTPCRTLAPYFYCRTRFVMTSSPQHHMSCLVPSGASPRPPPVPSMTLSTRASGAMSTRGHTGRECTLTNCVYLDSSSVGVNVERYHWCLSEDG